MQEHNTAPVPPSPRISTFFSDGYRKKGRLGGFPSAAERNCCTSAFPLPRDPTKNSTHLLITQLWKTYSFRNQEIVAFPTVLGSQKHSGHFSAVAHTLFSLLSLSLLSCFILGIHRCQGSTRRIRLGIRIPQEVLGVHKTHGLGSVGKEMGQGDGEQRLLPPKAQTQREHGAEFPISHRSGGWLAPVPAAVQQDNVSLCKCPYGMR